MKLAAKTKLELHRRAPTTEARQVVDDASHVEGSFPGRDRRQVRMRDMDPAERILEGFAAQK